MRTWVISNLYEIHEYKYENKIRYVQIFVWYKILPLHDFKKRSYKMTNIGLKYHTMF